ncbi:hypothetical protein OIE69_43540 (plasmid) [Actinacidiphila glaucinigra]|uniref:hypothetical protein n=1 Tax=Actinacidiphila glaucinigra TaxID=235986 RepID=UPI002DD9E89C|nr:hypothetical protein [Actinacidiphila glaucinigra]WSD65783.1 hypothetical protein OIE69_43540 [Actinacidiphila glaucinigra]
MNDWRDAVEAPPWEPGEPPACVEPIPEYPRQRVHFQLDGRLYRAAVMERREHADGRKAVHLMLWPTLSDGQRKAWFWWDPEVFEVRAPVTALSPVEGQLLDGDVVRVPRGKVPHDQIPKYESFQPGQQPQVQVRVGGHWHDGVVWHKIRYRDGRHAVQVKVTFLEGDGFRVVYWRTYWWNPDAIRVVP